MKTITIDFYQKPKLCSNALHKIDFLCENDKYNPFAAENRYSSNKMHINDSLNELIVDLAMHKDLGCSKRCEIEKAHIISEKLCNLIKKEMEKEKIEFKRSSKYFLQSIYAKIKIKYSNTLVTMFFELVGMSYHKKIRLTNVWFLKSFVNSIMS